MANTYTQKTVAWKHGINTLYAGTPLDTNGKTVNDETAIGILAEDLHMPDKTAKVLTAGEWDEDAHTASGIVISDAVKLKLKDITFSRPPKSLDVLALYVQKTDMATKEAAGIVKQSESVSSAAAAPTKADFNGLVEKLKDAGIIEPDSFNVSVLACPTPAQMPTAETAANSGHATVSLSQGKITIALDCEVDDLAEANHGETWGTHKWLGFGVRTGLASIVGVTFTDDTGASATMGAEDATEASDLGLSAGDFILYIKAEDAAYLTGEKSFTLKASGYAPVTISMEITETHT